MSLPGPRPSRSAEPVIPRGDVVATFDAYTEAQAAVERLGREEFPVQKAAIIGHDLTSVERVTGRLSWGRVAFAGALSGVWLGLFFGIVLLLFAPDVQIVVLVSTVLLGAGFGMLFALVSYAVNRRRRDFMSVMQVVATRYSVLVDPEHSARARVILGTSASGATIATGDDPAVGA